MRTNSLNLKKKIAFIASLAMLASTAAYLPADIANQIGLNSAIVNADEAKPNTIGTTAADSTPTEGNIETLSKVYLTIDGKYVATDGTSYKTFSSLSAINGGFEAVNVLDNEFINTPFVEDNEPVKDSVTTTEYKVSDLDAGGALATDWETNYDTDAKKAALLVANDTYNKESNTNYEVNTQASPLAYTLKIQEYQTANVFKKTTITSELNEYYWNRGTDFGKRIDDYAEENEKYTGKYYIIKESLGADTKYYEVNGTDGAFNEVVLDSATPDDSMDDTKARNLAKTDVVVTVKTDSTDTTGTQYDVYYVKETHNESTDDYYVELTDTQAKTKEYKKVAAPQNPGDVIDPTTWVSDTGVLNLTDVTFDDTANATEADLYVTEDGDTKLINDVDLDTGIGAEVVAVDGIDAGITTDQENKQPTTIDNSDFEVYTLGASTKYAVKTETVHGDGDEGDSTKTTYYQMFAKKADGTAATEKTDISYYELKEVDESAVSAPIENAEKAAYVRKVNYDNTKANEGKQAAVDALTLKDAPIAIPYSLVTPSSIIELVPEVADHAALTGTSAKKITITLNENGMYTVPENTTPIIAQTDTSNWDAAKKEFTGGAPDEGADYESFDFSGLKVTLDDNGVKEVSTGLTDKNNTSIAYTPVANNADAATPTYAYVKSGSVYARNIEATLNEAVKPNEAFKINLNPLANWTTSGKNISNNVLTLTMGTDGKVTSDLITFTRSTGEKEYYILTVKNVADNANEADLDTIEISDAATGIIGTEAKALKDIAGPGNTKVTNETVTKTVGSSSQFVTVYTVATNKGAKLTAADTVTLNAGSGVVLSVEGTGDNITTVADDNKTQATVKFAVDKTFDYSTPVLSYTKDGVTKYFQVVFTTTYDIPYYNLNSTDSAKFTDKSGTVSVTEGNKVTKPADPTRAGYTFKGWANDSTGSAGTTNGNFNDTTNKVFDATSSLQQGAEITPFDSLYAVWDTLDYTAKFDANGGYWEGVPSGTVATARDKDSNVTGVSATFTSGAEATGTVTIDEKTETTYLPAAGAEPERTGYTFIGWSTDKTATTPMTKDELDAARPLKATDEFQLYAVWEADENDVEFGYIDLEDDGTSKSGAVAANGTVSETYKDTFDGFFEFEDGVNTSEIKLVTDSKVGTLPTPIKKGFTFDGWYKQVKTTSGGVTAVKVTESSNVDPADIADDGDINLYAKFKQNTYTVTLDLDGGKITGDTDGKNTPVSYVVKKDRNLQFKNSEKTNNNITEYDDFGKLGENDYNVTKGAGFYVFSGWKATVDGKEGTYNTLSDIYAAMKTAGDIEAKAIWTAKNENTTNGSIAFETNGGEFYTGSAGSYTKAAMPGLDGVGDKSIAEKYTVNKATVTVVAGETYTLARPGYTFTGWFADKDCTTAFNFDVFPKGKEVTAYAGWKANTNTKYTVRYNLIGADGAVIIPASSTTDDINVNADADGYSFAKTYMGTTGAEVNAADKKVIYNGKTYVFSTTYSSGLTSKDKIRAAYKSTTTQDGGTTYAFENVVYGKETGEISETGNDNYTVLEAVFIDETAHDDKLGTVDDPTVDANGKVTWSAAENAVKYKVVKKIGDKTYYGKETEELSYQFGSVPKTEYKVRVVAFDKDGNKTWGKEVTITPAVDPKALGEIKNVKVAADRKTVTWDAVDNAATYKVMKTINGKNYYTSEIADTTVTFGSATKGAFSVKVIAINADGTEKKWSDAVSVEKVKSALGTVGNAKVSEDGVVTWDKVEGAAYYRVFKVTAGVKRFSDKVEGTSYKLNNVPTSCRIYVVAYDGNGNYAVGPQTRISNVAKATDVTVSADGTKVSWKGNDDAAQYQVAKLINGNTFYGKKVDAATTEYTFGSVAKAGTQVFVITFNADGDTSYSDAVTVK